MDFAKLIELFLSVFRIFNNEQKGETGLVLAEKLVDHAINNNSHPYLIEQAYVARTNRRPLAANEIVYFLNGESPSESLEIYSKAKGFIQLVENQLVFAGVYRKKLVRKWMPVFIALFAVISFVAFVLVGGFIEILAAHFSIVIPNTIRAIFIILVVAFFFAVLNLETTFSRGSKLVEKHQKNLP